jgi:hypothetical protein
MVTYRIMFLVGITVWHGRAYAADSVKIPLDDGCSLTFSVRNNSEADVEVWVSREMHYKRPDKTTFKTVARSARTSVRSGKNGTMVFYAPDCWVQNKLSKKQESSDEEQGDKADKKNNNESVLHVYALKYSFGGCLVQQSGTKVAPITLSPDGKTLTVEPLSRAREHNSCAE